MHLRFDVISAGTQAHAAQAQGLGIRPKALIEISWHHAQGQDALHSRARGCGVDPRNLAQRIMDVSTPALPRMEICALLANTARDYHYYYY